MSRRRSFPTFPSTSSTAGATPPAAGVETTLLASPTTTDERLRAICERSHGFVYGVSLLGVTGERHALTESALRMGRRLKATTDKPALLGVGISTPEQAAEAAAAADGVIVGSALVRRLLDGGGPEEAHQFVSELRADLDACQARTGLRRPDANATGEARAEARMTVTGKSRNYGRQDHHHQSRRPDGVGRADHPVHRG